MALFQETIGRVNVGFQGPIIFEIVEPTAQQVITKCVEAREVIIDAWNSDN